MAKRTRARRRKTAKRRNPRISKARRRAAALKGLRRKRRGGTKARRRNPRKRTTRRRRNARGLFKSRGGKSYGRRGKVVRTRRGRKRYSRPVRKSTLKRRARARRRNPNGFVGNLTKVSTWMGAGQIAAGGLASAALAGWVYNNYAPAALQSGMGRTVGRPLSMALAGAALGWACGKLLKQKALGAKIATGGLVAGLLDLGLQLMNKPGLMGMGDYVQLQGLGSQAQVEAGVFGLGNQAAVEAGNFDGMGDYVQLQGLGHTADATAAANTFGPTF